MSGKLLVCLLAIFAVCASNEDVKRNKCRSVRSTMLTCLDATENDLPNTKDIKVEWLVLTKSNFPVLKKSHLENFPSLTDVHAENNGIEKIEEDAFAESKVLDWVDVSYNKLTIIPVNLFENSPKVYYFNASGNSDLVVPQSGPIINAPNLQWLLLSECNIKSLNSDIFTGVPGLKVLSLSHNSLKTLPDNIFATLKGLYSLDLSKNQFTHLPVSLFKPMKYISLYMEGNPWNCDCELEPTVTFAKTSRLKDEVRCAKPNTKLWKEAVFSCNSQPVAA